MNSGTTSKRLYNHIGREYSPNTGLQNPKISITNEDATTYEIIFDNMSPLYSVHFLSEDVYGNVYFIFFYYQRRKPAQIWKYSPLLKLVARIDDIPYPEGFLGTKIHVLDGEGNIYVMKFSDTGIQVIKWYVK